MAALNVLTALRVESLAVGGADVVVGMGPSRARRAGAALSERLGADDAVALVGVAGGLAPHLRAGDLVVATELRTTDPGMTVDLPLSGLLAAELARGRRRVHAGALLSSPRYVGTAARASLATTGAIAVDMESAWLCDPLRHHPLAVVRAISDTAERSPVLGGLPALRSLRGVREPLERWARACGPHELLVAAPRSFCAGVERAIEIVERAIARYGAPVYVRRQIVHNAHVVRDLEAKGAVFVEELDDVPDEAVVVFAAHGVAPIVRADAARRPDLTVVDATCPLVAKVHAEARRYAARDYTLVLIGHAEHEEVVGTVGEAPDRIHVVADADDVHALDVDEAANVAILTQTTLATDETAVVVDALRARFRSVTSPSADDICYATQNRQDAVRAIARRCDLMLVVGSQNSSNTARLVELARREGTRAELLEDVHGLELAWLDGARTIGLTAGASVPDALVQEVVATFGHLGPLELSEERVADEDVRFALPGSVR
jgi:4-hydroxy-3-methylbut-2-en-1-yl diphosphate reductase